MKKIILFLFLILWCFIAQGQNEFYGIWKSNEKIKNIDSDIYLSLDNEKGYLSIPFQSIDSSATSELNFLEDSLILNFGKLKKSYSCIHQKNGLKCISNENVLVFSKVDSIRPLSRPQEPKAPYPYTIIDTTFFNSIDSITLAGTLTIPKGKGPFPTAILVSGSGPQDRNSEILGHKSFLLIADYLTKRGVAVFRYDDRGFGASEGIFVKATTANLATDAEAAVNFVHTFSNKVDTSQLGIIGHSEGGIIAPMVQSKNKKVDFIVSLAGPGVKITELMTIQNKLVYEKMGFSKNSLDAIVSNLPKIYAIVNTPKPPNELYEKMMEAVFYLYDRIDAEDAQKLSPSKEAFYMTLAAVYFNPWYRYFLSMEPAQYWGQVSCPVFALNGSEDIQVSAAESLYGIEDILKKNKVPVTIKNYQGLNHLFQKCTVCSVDEYIALETTIEEEVLSDITSFIKSLK